MLARRGEYLSQERLAYLWGDIMGVRSIKICERHALELSCDGVAHATQWRSAWFDSGTDSGNFALATAVGWSEWRAEQAWLCPQCAQRVERNARPWFGATGMAYAATPARER